MSCSKAIRCVRHKGFGLVELMIAMTIGLVLVLGVSHVFVSSKRSFLMQQQLSTMQENARFVLTRISRDIRQAGVFGCLDLQRLPVAMRRQLPAIFNEPLQYSDGVLTLLSAVAAYEPVVIPVQHSADEYDARWLLASNCLNELRVTTGAESLMVNPGDVLIPVRQVEYRMANHTLQTRINGAGNFETLIDGIADFDVHFGLSDSVAAPGVAGNYVAAFSPAQAPLVRSVRIALALADNPVMPEESQVRMQQYTLVTALRSRLD